MIEKSAATIRNIHLLVRYFQAVPNSWSRGLGSMSSTSTTHTSGGLSLVTLGGGLGFFLRWPTSSLSFRQPCTNSLRERSPSPFTSRWWKMSVAFCLASPWNHQVLFRISPMANYVSYHSLIFKTLEHYFTLPTPSSSSRQVIVLTISFKSIDPEFK